MQGDYPNGYLGIHSGGHYTIGGDPGGVRILPSFVPV
jgi:tyrosinase